MINTARIGLVGTRGAMNEEDKKSGHDAQGSPATSSEDHEVRATMEQIREALEASGAEIERSKRLLSETEDLLDLPASSEPEGSDE